MIQGGVCSSFKREMFFGLHHFDRDRFRIALYGEDAVLDPDHTTAYRTEGEITAAGYEAGGRDLSNVRVMGPKGRVAYVTFDDPIWPGSTIEASGALVYNQTAGQRAVAVLNFGRKVESNRGNFRVKFPPPGPDTALLRLL